MTKPGNPLMPSDDPLDPADERQPDPEPGGASDRPSSAILQQLAEHVPGKSRYQLRGEVARGGMGAILRVWDEDLRRDLAMKVVLGLAGDDSPPTVEERTLSRFLEEAMVTGQLDHPGVVPVHELGVDGTGRVYFTMRLVKGRDLRDVLELVRTREDGWTQTRALGVLLKACEALAYAHGKGVIHRDLKPANIMVGRYGEVYVMDWGLAKVRGRKDAHDLRLRPDAGTSQRSLETPRRREADESPDSPIMTMDGAVVGTPAFMSPEQARGEAELVDERSDVYALGGILYQLLTGQMPYVPAGERRSARTILAAVLAAPPRPVHELARVPPELEAICDKAMARERARRYGDVSKLADDLRAYLEQRVVSAYETGALAELRKWVVRNRSLASAMAAVLALVLVAGGVVLGLNEQLSRSNADLAEEQRISEDRRREAEQNAARAESNAALAEEQRAQAESNAAIADEQRARAESNAAIADEQRARAESSAAAADEQRARAQSNALLAEQQRELAVSNAVLAEDQRVQAESNATLAERERRRAEASAALAEQQRAIATAERDIVLRLVAMRDLENLQREVAGLQPFEADLEAFDDWLARADRLLAGLDPAPDGSDPGHRAALDRLRQRVLASAGSDPAIEGGLRPSSGEQDVWLLEQLSRLVSDLDAFADPFTGLLAGTDWEGGWSMRRRRDLLAPAATAEVEERWRQAIASIADAAECPAYQGLRMERHRDLVPLGRDPASGLWEFWHVVSGDEPARDASGRIACAPGTGIVLVLVPAGRFLMGSPRNEEGRNYREEPRRQVTLDAFLLAKTECTQRQWQALTGSNPSNSMAAGLEAPVEQVSWDDIRVFGSRTGLGLPSEAQWEYSARAGATGARHGDLDTIAWHAGNAGSSTHPVGQRQPNEFGLHDMLGNVWEWCADTWHDDYSSAPKNGSAWVDSGSTSRVIRGGGWGYDGSYCRSARRSRLEPGGRDRYVGFRPSRSLQQVMRAPAPAVQPRPERERDPPR